MLLDDVRSKFNDARKNRDEITKSALEAVIAAVLLKQKSGKGDLMDADVIECVSKEIKVQTEIAELYKEKDMETSTLAQNKIAVLKEFLPAQLTEEEVLAIIKEKDIYEDASPKTKGMIIKSIMPLLVGKFDKSKVNGLVEEYLKTKC